VILFSAMVQSVLGYLQFFGGAPFYIEGHHNPNLFIGSVWKTVGTFQGSGKYAEFIFLGFCLVVGTRFDKDYLNRSVGLILIVLFFIIVIMSGSRAICALMIATPALMLLLLGKKGVLSLRNIMRGSILLASAMAIFFVIASQYFSDPTTQQITENIVKRSDQDLGPLGIRGAINWAAIDMFLEDPIVGKGYGTFSQYSAPYVMRYGIVHGHEGQDWEAHNVYAMNLVDNGLIGFILFLGVLVSGFMNFRQAFRGTPNDDRVHVIILVSFFVYYIGQLLSMFFGYGLYFHLMLILGISAALRNMTQKQARRPEHNNLTWRPTKR